MTRHFRTDEIALDAARCARLQEFAAGDGQFAAALESYRLSVIEADTLKMRQGGAAEISDARDNLLQLLRERGVPGPPFYLASYAAQFRKAGPSR
jgi:hypothetical protein